VHAAGASAGSTRDAAGIPCRGHAGNQRLQTRRISRGRDGRQDVLVDDVLHFGALHVDDRRFACDSNGFLEGADFQIPVYRGDERALELDAFPLHRAEARQRKGHRIGARPQIDDSILAGRIGHRGSHALDKRGARRFDGDSGQDGTGRVLDDAGDDCLSQEGCREENQGNRRDEEPKHTAH
jgi:hypothetical protein